MIVSIVSPSAEAVKPRRQGIIRSRDDLIRILSEENFEITDVTAQSITLCAPDEPENRVTLDGWLFSAGFSLSVPADHPELWTVSGNTTSAGEGEHP